MSRNRVINWTGGAVLATLAVGAMTCYTQEVRGQLADLQEDNRVGFIAIREELNNDFSTIRREMATGFAEQREINRQIYDLLLERAERAADGRQTATGQWIFTHGRKDGK